MAVHGGCVNKWKGKQLADISVEELPAVDENESDDDAVEERGSDPIEFESIESDEGVDAMETKITESDEGRFYPIVPETSEAVTCNSETETLLRNQTRPAISIGKPGRKVPWSRSTEEFLRKAFKSYLTRSATSVHNAEIILAQYTCLELFERTFARIRSKLQNKK